MTRGDQRERDRAKNLAKKAGVKQTGDPAKRKEADAKALQEKIAAKKAAAEGGAGSGDNKKK